MFRECEEIEEGVGTSEASELLGERKDHELEHQLAAPHPMSVQDIANPSLQSQASAQNGTTERKRDLQTEVGVVLVVGQQLHELRCAREELRDLLKVNLLPLLAQLRPRQLPER
eukprot:1630827-Rhodomonas_salina.1